jgi:hypothetical protein
MCRVNLPFAILHVAALLAVVAFVEGHDDVAVLTSKVVPIPKYPFTASFNPQP